MCVCVGKVLHILFFLWKNGQDILFFLTNMVIGMGCSFVSSLNELCSLINSCPLATSPLVFLLFFFQSILNHKGKKTNSLFFISTFRFWPQPNLTKNTSTPKFLHCKAHKNSCSQKFPSTLESVHCKSSQKNTFSQKFSHPRNFIH